jgi:hypothetical protein
MALSSTTDAGSPTSGALTVAGGVGIAKTLEVGKNINYGYAGSAGSYGNFKSFSTNGSESIYLASNRTKNNSVQFQTLVHLAEHATTGELNPANFKLLNVIYNTNDTWKGTLTTYLNMYHVANDAHYSVWSSGGRINLQDRGAGDTTISVDGKVQADGFIPFTGAHVGFTKDINAVDGDILIDNIILLRRHISDTISEAMVSSVPNQKGAIGVLAGRPTEVPRKFFDETSDAYIEPSLLVSSEYIHMNALGEGQINVCGENGNIEKGDLIVTSAIPGKGMRQSDDIVRSYTVAKARESVSFSSTSEVKMIACIYMCG